MSDTCFQPGPRYRRHWIQTESPSPEIVLPTRHPLRHEVKIPVAILTIMEKKERIHKFNDSSTADDVSGDPATAPSKKENAGYPVIFTICAYMVFALIAGGIIGTIVRPSKITELGVPLGLTLWAILASAIGRFDRRQTDE